MDFVGSMPTSLNKQSTESGTAPFAPLIIPMKTSYPHRKSFDTIDEAIIEFSTPEEFRVALVDDVHFKGGRFDRIGPRDLLEACGVEIGSNDAFCLSEVPSNRAAFNRGDETGWTRDCTYRIPGKNRRTIRFFSRHGEGGVCEGCEGPYIYTRSKILRQK